MTTYACSASATGIGAEITPGSFGSNLVWKEEQGFDPVGTGAEALRAAAGVAALRFPGGTVTEDTFRLDDPADLAVLRSFFDYAGNVGVDAVIVLPTYTYFTEDGTGLSAAERAEIATFIGEALAMAQAAGVTIRAFELGNEFYQYSWSAAQYGQLAAAMAQTVEGALVAQGTPVDLWVQTGQTAPEAQAIRAAFDAAGALPLVDGAVSHFYTTNRTDPLGIGGVVDGRLAAVAAAWGSGVDLVVTEWNVGENTPTTTATRGLMRSAGLLRSFAEMVGNGVSDAMFWQVLTKRMSGLGALDDGREGFTPTGYLFRMMQESLIGTKLLASGGADPQVSWLDDANGVHWGAAYAYAQIGGPDRSFWFTSGVNTANTLQIDLSAAIAAGAHVYGTRLAAASGAPDDFFTDAMITHLTAADLGILPGSDGVGFVTLGAYETLRIVVSYGAGLHLYGDDQHDVADRINGSDWADTIEGNGGADSLSGSGGADLLEGGAGADTLWGGAGNDTLRGGAENDSLEGDLGADSLDGGEGDDMLRGGANGNSGDGTDRIFGQAGNDTLSGGAGNDHLNGGTGDDFIWGEWGNDYLLGDDGRDRLGGSNGDDTLIGGRDNDTLTGGAGADRFCHSGQKTDGIDLITDFNAAQDLLVFTRDISNGVYAGMFVAVIGTVAGAGSASLADATIRYTAGTSSPSDDVDLFVLADLKSAAGVRLMLDAENDYLLVL